jgi:hypothetical protein
MIPPTERNVWINLRSMARFVSMMKLMGRPMAPECRELPCGKGLYARPSTGRLAKRKHLVAVVKPVTRRSPRAVGIDMTKAHLHLISCSDDIEPEAMRRRRGRSFQLSVIDGGKRAIDAPREKLGETMLDLFDLGILVCRANYLAFAAASLTAIELHGWADFQIEQSDRR